MFVRIHSSHVSMLLRVLTYFDGTIPGTMNAFCRCRIWISQIYTNTQAPLRNIPGRLRIPTVGNLVDNTKSFWIIVMLDSQSKQSVRTFLSDCTISCFGIVESKRLKPPTKSGCNHRFQIQSSSYLFQAGVILLIQPQYSIQWVIHIRLWQFSVVSNPLPDMFESVPCM